MKILRFCVIILSLTVLSAAQNNALLIGTSSSGGGLLRGVDAAGNNPSYLGLSDNVRGSISTILLPNLSYNFQNSFPVHVYNDYMAKGGDNSWSESDVNEILDYIGDKWRIQNSLDIDIFSISIENTAVSFTANSVQNMAIPADFLELAFRGNEIGKIYDAGELDGEIFNSFSIGVSYGQLIENNWINQYFEEFSIGGSFRLIHSVPITEMDDIQDSSDVRIRPAYMKLKNIDSYITASDITGEGSSSEGATVVKGSFEILISEAGLGFGTDLGMSGVINDRMKVGLSVTNLFSYVNWYKNNRSYTYNYIMDGITFDEFEDSEEDSLFTDDETVTKKDFGTFLPPELRLDYVWEFHNGNHNTYWTSSYIQGFFNELDTTVIPEISTGCEWYHSSAEWLKLRTGISAGGEPLFSAAAGFGLKIKGYSLDFGIQNKYFFGGYSKGVSMALSQKIEW